MTTLLLATRNRGKVAELQALLAPLGFSVLSLDQVPPVPQVEEDGDTFEHNARKKAIETANASGFATLADDSGLEVDALDGAPGVHSARFAGPDADDASNNDKLMVALREVPEDQRTARFVAVLALAIPADAEGFGTLGPADPSGGEAHDNSLAVVTFRGTLEGRIASEPAGSEGFGYDPLFIPTGHGATLAQLGKAMKNQISHRAAATRALTEHLRARLARP